MAICRPRGGLGRNLPCRQLNLTLAASRTVEKHILVGEAPSLWYSLALASEYCPLLATRTHAHTHTHTHIPLKMRNSFKKARKGERVLRQVLYACVVAMVRGIPRKPRFICWRAGWSGGIWDTPRGMLISRASVGKGRQEGPLSVPGFQHFCWAANSFLVALFISPPVEGSLFPR